MSNPMAKKIQTILGVQADGIWGPKSQGALNREIRRTGRRNPKLARIQRFLEVSCDGLWGPVSQTALNQACAGGGGTLAAGSKRRASKNGTPGFAAEASSFADPDDVLAFVRCKATGASDLSCFKVGDNGVGQFGKVTAQAHTPMVAIHKDDMIARWGSVNAAAHRVVNITVDGKTIQATVEDRLGVAGRIDLNPACAELLGLKPPFLVRCSWEWA